MKDISLILARFLMKATGKNEADALSDWGKSSEKNARFVNLLDDFWNLGPEEKPYKRMDAVRERLIVRLRSAEETPSRRTPVFYLSRIAAAIILLLSVSGLSVYIARQTAPFNKNNWVEISTEAGQQSKVTLPDGSLVWINAETVLKYHPDKKERKVSLTGEAYFEVVHTDRQPFIVEAGNAKVKVLGTKFNVSHYSGSKITEASLLSGKIAMSFEGNSNEIELAPGEKIVYDAEQQLSFKKEVKVQNDILWRQGILIFDNQPFNELISRLERYYAVKFIYEKNDFENIHYTGSVNNLNINKVLEFISLTIPVEYAIDNKTIKMNLKKMKK